VFLNFLSFLFVRIPQWDRRSHLVFGFIQYFCRCNCYDIKTQGVAWLTKALWNYAGCVCIHFQPLQQHCILHIQSFAVCLINQGMYISQVRVKVVWFVWWEIEDRLWSLQNVWALNMHDLREGNQCCSWIFMSARRSWQMSLTAGTVCTSCCSYKGIVMADIHWPKCSWRLLNLFALLYAFTATASETDGLVAEMCR